MSENDSEETIKLNFNFNFLKNKKVQWGIVIVLFALIAVLSVGMRLSNLPNLVDHTTGNYTLSDPDALYWLRLEGHLLSTGNLNGIDTMRNPGLNLTYSHDLIIYTITGAYKLLHSFNENITLRFVDTVYPAWGFLLALIIFFFLLFFLTESKTASVIGSFFLAYSPAFLFRTVSGVSGHEALGIMFLFAVFLVFILGLKKFSKGIKESVIWGLLTGLLITFSFAAWGGTINFIFLILPISMLLYYLFNVKEDKKLKEKFLIFYFTWILFSGLFTLLVHFSPMNIYNLFFSPTGALVPSVFLFVLIDYLFEKVKKVKHSKYKILISAGTTVVLGIVFLFILGKGGFDLIGRIYSSLIHPLGEGRVGLTVAYYAQPYLTDFQGQIGISFFWLFLIGICFLWVELVKGINSVKHKTYLALIGVISIIGILFSRYSSTSTLNGVNFISQLIYFGGLLALAGSLIYLYFNYKDKINTNLIFAFAWMVVMLITVRAAQRTIFLVVPFIAFIASYLIIKSIVYFKKSKTDGRKFIFGALAVLALILAFLSLFGNPFTGTPGNFYISNVQAQNTGPLMDTYWQNAMNWVRTNTSTDSVFLHWWDYGYILQTEGERTTVLDGGNTNAYWDHLMARYVLTTPNPDTAKSFMKAHNVTYLLIDPTDIGKYSAYSSIGDAANTSDRASYLPTFVSDPKETQETINGTTRIYRGGFGLDSDLILTSNGKKVLLPKGNAGLYAFAVQRNNQTFSQPIGIYVYNNQQYQAPIRYLYFPGTGLMDFKTGVNATVYLYPGVQGQKFDVDGAGMYFSEKTMNSLVAQLYLMNDPNNLYPELTLADQEGAYPFNFYYGGFRGPIKIYKINYSAMPNIIGRSEFLSPSGEYGAFDNLTFTK